jgi:hypothetical protein
MYRARKTERSDLFYPEYFTGKKLKIHRMEIVWTFIGNRMDFDYP